jgi:primosomal protein N'
MYDENTMNIITVILLSRAKIAPELSYFTASEMPVGAVVCVPLRSKQIYGIVTRVQNAEDLKGEIKTAGFEIKKLNKIKASVFFPASFIAACNLLAEYYATNVGAIIDSLVSDSLLENVAKIAPPLPPQASFGTNEPFPGKVSKLSGEGNVYAVQGDDPDRMSSWRSLIRQEFARKKSIAIYVPTIEDCNRIFGALEKGIEGYIFKLNSGLSKKKIVDTWKVISETDHPIVVISTGTFSLLPRGDIETVVIEQENGRGWIGQKAPYIDLRHAIEDISKKRRQNVFLADSLLRTETLYRLDQGEIDPGSPFKWRSISDARDSLIDMRRLAKPQSGSSKPDSAFADSPASAFRVLSAETEATILKNSEENTHMFILAVRRGTASMTVCDDCETVVTCRNCSAPVVLHTSENSGKNFFMCHKCGERRSADETCVNCGSWRLTPLGIGIERVHEEIKTRFPGIDIFKIDSDTTKTEKQISTVLEKFKARPGSILLGTELALQHFADKVEHVAVVSLDSLFALPDFRIQEKIMYTLIRLRAQATRSISAQTRKPEEKVFEYGLKGNLSDFHRATIEERKRFAYPPFVCLVKITIEGKKDAIAEQMAEVQKILNPHELDIFPAFTSTLRGNSVIHGLIKFESHSWPDADLVQKIRALPPGVSVKINPESLL